MSSILDKKKIENFLSHDGKKSSIRAIAFATMPLYGILSCSIVVLAWLQVPDWDKLIQLLVSLILGSSSCLLQKLRAYNYRYEKI